MRRASKILLVLVVVAVAWSYLLTGTPPFGRKLTLKSAPIASVELNFMSSYREISSSNLCAEVIHTMQKAREGGQVHLCPSLGSLTVRFADGTTNRFDLMPGHRFNRLDLVDSSGLYSISSEEMIGTLEKVGLKMR